MSKPLYKNSGFWLFVIVALAMLTFFTLGIYEVWRMLERLSGPENEGRREEPAKNGMSRHGYILSVKEFEKCVVKVVIV